MRIREWSSDLCSSDLPVLEALEPRSFADRRAVGGIVDRRALCDVADLLDHRDAVRQCVDGAAIVMAHVDEAALVASAQRFFAQIGRASCRERVCQYV